MGEHASLPRCQPSFGGDDLAGLRHDMCFGPDTPSIAGDRSRKIDLGLDCPEAGARGNERVARAPGRAVDQCHGPSTMRGPHRIEQMVAGLALECREAIADLDQPEPQSFRDRRVGQASIDDACRICLPVSWAISSGFATPYQ